MITPKFTSKKGKLLPEGWLKEYIDRDVNGITGNLDKLFKDAGSDVFGKEKVIHEENGYWSSWWAGETRGNWMEALVRLSFYTENKSIKERAKAIIDGLIENQSPDGYIGIYQEGHRYVVTSRFGEYWTQSRAMRTLLAWYNETEEERVLIGLIKMADNIVKSLDTPDGKRASLFSKPDEDGSKGHSLMIIDGLYEMFILTGNEAYRDFCIYLYKDYCEHPSTFIQDDLRAVNLMDEDSPFVGHGPHTAEMLRLPLLIYQMTEDKTYLEYYRRALEKLDQNRSLSGSCKSDEFIGIYQNHIVEDSGGAMQFGGSIPLPTAGYEYCTTAELAIDFTETVKILGDLNFSEQLEWLTFNAGMAAKLPNGKAIQYICCDNMYDATRASGARYDYSPTHADAAVCCAPNSCKLMPLYISNMYLTDGKGILANQYLPSTFKSAFGGAEVTFIETTDYPFNFEINWLINTQGDCCFPFSFRIPKWSKGYSLFVNGQAQGSISSDVVTVDRKWQDGDTVKLKLFPHLTVIEAIDHTKALSYGTLLFSLPIEASEHKYYRYPGAHEFYDIDFTTAPHADWNYTLLESGDNMPKNAFAVDKQKTGYPWENSPLKLSVMLLDKLSIPRQIELEPIGCTTLRRTTFPHYADKRGIFKITEEMK